MCFLQLYWAYVSELSLGLGTDLAPADVRTFIEEFPRRLHRIIHTIYLKITTWEPYIAELQRIFRDWQKRMNAESGRSVPFATLPNSQPSQVSLIPQHEEPHHLISGSCLQNFGRD